MSKIFILGKEIFKITDAHGLKSQIHKDNYGYTQIRFGKGNFKTQYLIPTDILHGKIVIEVY
jgi:hypothetical protein